MHPDDAPEGKRKKKSKAPAAAKAPVGAKPAKRQPAAAPKPRERKAAAPAAPVVPTRKPRRAVAAAPVVEEPAADVSARTRRGLPSLAALTQLGRDVLGIKQLRPGQGEALGHILAGRDVLAVMPTGSGKSLLYQLPSLVLPGITVVVSPLIALIKDQIDKMKAKGVAVCRVDSTLTVKQKREMVALVNAPGGKLMLTTPERMADPEFRVFLREAAGNIGVSLFVVDEAHCVSQWGHDFRPAYLVIRKALEDLGRPPVLATTATAPPHVREDILHQLGMPREGGEAHVVTTTFDRPNLHYEVITSPGDDDKVRTLVTLLKKLPRPGIVYCATVKKVEELAESLARHGIPIGKYHGRLNKNERDAEQVRFMAAKDQVMIATNAFGLGVDKREIRYVLHFHVPGSLEQYAQEAGRGGRDGKPARCVLLFSPDDVLIQEYFLKGTYPTRRQVRAVYKTLEAWDVEAPATLENLALGAGVGIPRTRTVLSLLKDEGFVLEDDRAAFALTQPPPDQKILAEKAKQYEARRIADRQKLDALLAYVGTAGCRSQVILSYLGEDEPPPCGRCDNCMRSREAALAAAQRAAQLEDGVILALREDDEEDEREGIAAPRRVVRARLIRIDTPAVTPAAAATPTVGPAASPAREPAPAAATSASELARLVAEQEADRRGAVGRPPEPEPAADDDDDDDLDDDDDDNDLDEADGDDDGDDLDDDDDDDDGMEVDSIDQTAAALAEAGVAPGDSEITVLARKRQPKPLRKKKPTLEPAPELGKKKRRRRRRRKAALPPASAFTSPVLTRDQTAPASPSQGGGAQGGAPRSPSASSGSPGKGGGPLIEYVRGPLRINMTPVASATPNDTPPGRHGKKKRRHGRDGRGDRFGQQDRRPSRGPLPPQQGAGPGGNPNASSNGTAGGHGQPGLPSAPGEGRRRRRRRRKRRGGDAQGGLPPELDAPVTFFSTPGGQGGGARPRPPQPGPGPAPANGGPSQASGGQADPGGQPLPGSGKRRRRRRRRGRGGRGPGAPDGSAPQASSPGDGAPVPPPLPPPPDRD